MWPYLMQTWWRITEECCWLVHPGRSPGACHALRLRPYGSSLGFFPPWALCCMSSLLACLFFIRPLLDPVYTCHKNAFWVVRSSGQHRCSHLSIRCPADRLSYFITAYITSRRSKGPQNERRTRRRRNNHHILHWWGMFQLRPHQGRIRTH